MGTSADLEAETFQKALIQAERDIYRWIGE